jgi:transposase-like protein
LREVEELMVVRGVIVCYATIRQWCAKFAIASPLTTNAPK